MVLLLSYGADTKLHLKLSRRNIPGSMKVRVVIFVRDTLSWPVVRTCDYISKSMQVTERTRICRKKTAKGR